MPVDKESYHRLKTYFAQKAVQLVAVSKTKPVSDIMELYEEGQRDFGENYVQELMAKQAQLPKDIRWHFIGHLQSNKIKYIASYVHLIHGVDSLKMLLAINKEAVKTGSIIHVLLQMHIAREETKFGFDETELNECLSALQQAPLSNVCIAGFMGMASFLTDENAVREEFKVLRNIAMAYFPKFSRLNHRQVQMPMVISMGMSNDYQWAVEEGSTMVRIGSLLFGSRQ